jgi:hypothetical protein
MPSESRALRREPLGDGSSRHSKPDRLADLEAAVAAIHQTLDVQFKRMAAIQSELDVLAGEIREMRRNS